MANLRRGLTLSRGGIRSRRKTGWSAGPGGTALTPISASSTVILGSAIIPLVDGLTLVRLRGEVNMYLQLATAANDGFAGAFGVSVQGLSAFNAGAASLEAPIDEEDWDGWLYHRYFSVHSPVAFALASSPGGEVLPSVLRFEVDSKAMRKIQINEVLVALVQVTEIGTANMEIGFNSRMLFKLP